MVRDCEKTSWHIRATGKGEFSEFYILSYYVLFLVPCLEKSDFKNVFLFFFFKDKNSINCMLKHWTTKSEVVIMKVIFTTLGKF